MAAKKMGRPSMYSDALATEICRRLAEGESLRNICREKGMPEWPTVRTWLREKSDFLTRYAQARKDQADTYADLIVTEAFSAEDAQLGRLRVDALKWAASKLAPKKYGDKLELEQSGQLDIVVKIGGETVAKTDLAT
jgi:hypothetical protein